MRPRTLCGSACVCVGVGVLVDDVGGVLAAVGEHAEVGVARPTLQHVWLFRCLFILGGGAWGGGERALPRTAWKAPTGMARSRGAACLAQARASPRLPACRSAWPQSTRRTCSAERVRERWVHDSRRAVRRLAGNVLAGGSRDPARPQPPALTRRRVCAAPPCRRKSPSWPRARRTPAGARWGGGQGVGRGLRRTYCRKCAHMFLLERAEA
jgi:hypothetical protein